MPRWIVLCLGIASVGCAHTPPPMTGHDPLPESHWVSGEQAVRLVIGGALLVDVSEEVTYYGRHLRGAYNIPYHDLELRMDELPRDRPLVVYSEDGRNASGADLILRANGYDVHLLGSFADWELEGAAPGS